MLRAGVGTVSGNRNASDDQGAADCASDRMSVAGGASRQGGDRECKKDVFHFVSVADLSAYGAKSMDKSSMTSRIINP
jgi:hypothetical protein